MSKTIKALADELNVSKTAIRKYLTEDFRRNYVETDTNNIIKIAPDGCKLIAEMIGNRRNQFATTTENTVSANVLTIPREVWEALQTQIAAQNSTIEAQRKQIDDYSERLKEANASLKFAQESAHAAQALHAGTMQKQLQEPETVTTVVEEKSSFWNKFKRKR